MQQKDLKEFLYQYCSDFVKVRIERIQSRIEEVQRALESETKSSAGDKHETGRAMLQLEREKLGGQLAEAKKMKEILVRVNIKEHTERAILGTMVKTSGANYFLAISAGECRYESDTYYCISVATPIGQQLLGKSVGDSITFHGKETTIIDLS